MSRKLATIRVVKQLLPIEGADRIELALIDGWQCVVQKGEFQQGQLAVYFEIDSFLDSKDPRFASFEERFINWGGKRGMRVKTIKLRKQLSQGLLMPVSKFHEIEYPDEGDDVTDLLKIEKWEPIEEARSNNGGTKSGGGRPFPSFIVKTDQERIQNYGAMVNRALDEEFEETIKLDGSSLTAYVVAPGSQHYAQALAYKARKLGIFGKVKHWFKLKLGMYKEPVVAVCSRNLQLKDNDGSNFWKVVDKYKLVDILYKEGLNGNSIAIQGEMIGPDIQENHEQVQDHEFYCFDIYDIDRSRYVLPADRQNFCLHRNVPHVPVLGVVKLRDIPGVEQDVIKALLDRAEGPGMNKGVKREGIVYKAMYRDFSFKCVSNSYLLKKG